MIVTYYYYVKLKRSLIGTITELHLAGVSLFTNTSPLSILTLSARCVSSACTSVQTEIIYEDLPPSTWRASVKFIEKDEWKKVSFS